MNNTDQVFPTEDAPDGLLHGWYSKKQENFKGSLLYRKSDGTIQQVSEVSKPPKTKEETETSMWNDMKYVGLVESFVERATHGIPGCGLWQT